FRLAPGEAIAVIGPSAGGKSTLCRLLVGIAAPSAGEVRLDGSELSHFNPEDLGRHLGYLPQDVELFSGTVRDNIARMGEADDDAVVAAAMLAHAHDMIQLLPQGYDTQIGEAGTRLSGGQRQRIGLARAVYGNPCLVILDEPNANLDQAGEAALAAAVEELKRRGAALLIVGHRPSTLAQADKVMLLKDGCVEVFGAREDVLTRLRIAASNMGRKDATQPHRFPPERHLPERHQAGEGEVASRGNRPSETAGS
ncbi:MAG: ATP-binding cassette domain-containing protein, partial [Blastochloris sp.]|nr:ATP-binding cassette domain-containing protein [Blastochloris sp.]